MKARNVSDIVLSISVSIVRAKFCILVLGVMLSVRGDPPAGYYQTALGKTGFELRAALHEIINDHIIIPYSSSSFDTADALRILDQDPVNPARVFLFYAQRSEATNTFPAWNREHLWPQSYGVDFEPARSDLFNLRAEDETVNSERGNKYFDITTTNGPGYRFPAHAEATQCSTDIDSWEPPPHVKGDIARSLFYMDVRYEGDRGNEEQLRLTDAVAAIGTANPNMGKLSTLLRWHGEDPVDAAERRRNDLIFERYQRNRNPFIDHPEWVNLVFRPQVFAARRTNQVQLSWDARWTNASLEGSANLRTWTAMGNSNPTTAISTTGVRFYRLVVP